MTYRGHHVLSTLIRCHFSPVESTGGQYVYTGGSNGVIWIYHLDGRVVQGESIESSRRYPPDTQTRRKNDRSLSSTTTADLNDCTSSRANQYWTGPKLNRSSTRRRANTTTLRPRKRWSASTTRIQKERATVRYGTSGESLMWRFIPPLSHPIVDLAFAFAGCNATQERSKSRKSMVHGGARRLNPRCALERCEGADAFRSSRFFSLATVLYVLSPPSSFTPPFSLSGVSFRIIVVVIAHRQTLASIACSLRSLSWNGNEPSLISTAWERHAGGDIAVHQWKGLGKGGLNRLEDWVEVSAANAGEGVGDDGRA